MSWKTLGDDMLAAAVANSSRGSPVELGVPGGDVDRVPDDGGGGFDGSASLVDPLLLPPQIVEAEEQTVVGPHEQEPARRVDGYRGMGVVSETRGRPDHLTSLCADHEHLAIRIRILHGDEDEIAEHDRRCANRSTELVLPDQGSGKLVDRVQIARVVSDVDVPIVEGGRTVDAEVGRIRGGQLDLVAMSPKPPPDHAARPIERNKLPVIDPHIDLVDIHGRRGLRGGVVSDGERLALPGEGQIGPKARTRR